MTGPLGRKSRQKSVRVDIPGILLGPRFKGLSRQFQVSAYLPMVIESDEIVLLIAHSISQFISLGYILRAQFGLAEGGIEPAEVGISHCKFRIDFGGPLQQRDDFGRLRRTLLCLHRRTEGPPSLERR